MPSVCWVRMTGDHTLFDYYNQDRQLIHSEFIVMLESASRAFSSGDFNDDSIPEIVQVRPKITGLRILPKKMIIMKLNIGLVQAASFKCVAAW